MSNREPEEIYPPRGYVLISAHNTDQLCHHAIFATLGSAREAAQIMQRTTGSDINVAVIGARHRASWDDGIPIESKNPERIRSTAWADYMRDNDPPTVS